MSVPLDRLYNFLHNICDHCDLIIYGFFPYGSRKLDDLKVIVSGKKTNCWFEMMIVPCMILHDQEPLMYHLYSKKDFANYLKNNKLKKLPAKLIDFFSNLHLRVCLHAITNAYDQTLLCHSEKNSRDLDLYQQHGFIGIYYWSHALIARDWYRYAEIDPKLAVDLKNITHDFLIYNRAWSGTREYRLTFIEALINNDLLVYCRTSFAPMDNQLHYTQHIFANSDLAISRHDLDIFCQPNTHDANSSADYCADDYANSAIEVVLETLFDDYRHHLTEKTLRPIACGRPFILVATQGSLQYLRQYGFETFDGLIDETYDTVINPILRLKAIVQEIKRISQLSHDEKQLLWSKLYKIAERNKKLFFSKEWHNSIVKEFKDNFDLAIRQLTISGKYQDTVDQLAANNHPEMRHWRNHNVGITSEDRLKFSQWIKENKSTFL
jgi:hypothetical protein